MIRSTIKAIKLRLTDPFWKNVATLFSGSALAQALPILVLPIITRIYTKEALGFYFVYAAIGMLTQIVASLQYQLAIVLPKEKKDAQKLLSINFILVVFISALIAITIWLLFDFIASFIQQKDLLLWLYAIPFSTLFLGWFNAISYYFNREKKYKIISVGKVTKSVVLSIFHIVFGIIGFLKSGLILGLILGQFASMLTLFVFLFKKTDFKPNFNFSELKAILFKYKDIPLFNTLISFLNTLSNQLPLFLLSRFFGTSAAADYGIANRILNTPLNLVSSSVGQVFFQESSNINNKKGDLHKLVKSIYKRLFKIGIIPLIIAAIFTPFIFKSLFGEQYISSALMVQIIIPWVFLGFLTQPVSSLFTVLKKQKFMSLINIVVLGFRFIALYLGFYLYNNMLISVLFYAIVGVLFNIFQLYYFLRISKENVTY